MVPICSDFLLREQRRATVTGTQQEVGGKLSDLCSFSAADVPFHPVASSLGKQATSFSPPRNFHSCLHASLSSSRQLTMSILSCHCNWSQGLQPHSCQGEFKKVPFFVYSSTSYIPPGKDSHCQQLAATSHPSARRQRQILCRAGGQDSLDSDESEDEPSEKSTEADKQRVNRERLRENLERIVGTDDSTFSGIDLATLIRNKYGRSYDIQLIKKEFMGRNLLALNVMWKYLEQRSFPLTEEEYILRLDDVANMLKCWGAVSHIRNSLANSKERPRIGKAVSIFIDMDESGGRSREWIYK